MMGISSVLKGPVGGTITVVVLILYNVELLAQNFIETKSSIAGSVVTKLSSLVTRGDTNRSTIPSPITNIQNHTNELQFTRRDNTTKSNPNNKENKTGAAPASPNEVSIVVHLSGEMGNQLSKLSFAKAVQLSAEKYYGINNTQLILRAQQHSKWYRAMKDTKTCFPKMRTFDFRAGNTQEVNDAYKKQTEWLGERNSSVLFLGDKCVHKTCIDEGLGCLKTLLKKYPNPPNTLVQPNSNISFPFLTAARFGNEEVMDRYYDDLRSFFVFDEAACCKLRPDPDESVFHFRNFRQEMPRVWNKYGFVELSPNKTAEEVFGHLNPGDKIAITTRFAGPEAQKYVSALESRGLVVRLVAGQAGVEDFCFLRSAKKELVGMSMSTYVLWAGFLGDADRVRLYSVDSPSRRQTLGDKMFMNYNWTNDELKRRILFELYKSEEADQLDQEQNH